MKKDMSEKAFNEHFNSVFSRLDNDFLEALFRGHLSEHYRKGTKSRISIPPFLTLLTYTLTNKEKSLILHYLHTDDNVNMMKLLAHKEKTNSAFGGASLAPGSLSLPDKFVGTPLELIIISNQTLVNQAKVVLANIKVEDQYYVEETEKHLKNIIESLTRFDDSEVEKLLTILTTINEKLTEIHHKNNIVVVDGDVEITVSKQELFTNLEIFLNENQ